MGKYLNELGLSYLIGLIKTALSGKSDTGHVHAAGDVTSGTFDAARIPSLAISKITNLQTTLDGKADDSDLDALLPKQPASSDLPAASTSNTLYALMLGNTFANNGKVSYLSKANFQTWLGWSDKADASHNHAASNITSGTLAVARGGTGAATAAVNKVFAGPSSGDDAAAPSFRSLVAADIPSLNASKITAGTLAVARGGTGAATAAANKVFAGPSSGTDAAAPSFRSLVAADIPSLNTSKLTAGTLGLARGGTNKSNTDVTYYGGKSLFSGTATTGTVTLSETAANYTWLLIQYRDNENHYSSKIIYSPNSKMVVLDMVYGVSGVGNLKSRTVTISGTSISNVSGSTMDAAHNGGANTTNHIYITNVWGWK